MDYFEAVGERSAPVRSDVLAAVAGAAERAIREWRFEPPNNPPVKHTVAFRYRHDGLPTRQPRSASVRDAFTLTVLFQHPDHFVARWPGRVTLGEQIRAFPALISWRQDSYTQRGIHESTAVQR
jgi:hypothetical protein